MLEFSDRPYRFFPPRRQAVIAWMLSVYNRHVHLPRVKQIHRVEVHGSEALNSVRRPGDRVLLVPNHPTHADPEIYLEATAQIGIATQIMAAYDVFLRSRGHAWVMQRIGAFSVDREGSDPGAMAEAIRTLSEGRYALTIFPEGNVYLQNDLVTPFHEGAAMLGLRCARTLAKAGGTRILAVPVSIKATYVGDVRPRVRAVLGELTKALEADVDPEGPAVDVLRAVGVAALRRNLRHRDLPVPEGPDLGTLIELAAGSVLARVERKMGLQPGASETLLARVRAVRRAVHQVRADPRRAADHAAAATWADEAMLAFRILSYQVGYVQTNPSLDRFAETVEKLAEDVYARAPEPFGPRCAFVRFGVPLDLSAHLDAFAAGARNTVSALTRDLELAVQDGVDALNQANPHPGGRLRVQE